MRAARGVLEAAALIVGASAVAGCGSSPGSKAASPATPRPGRANVSAAASYQSPEPTTLSWFFAINHKDKGAVVAHFEPAAPGHGKWLNGDQAFWADGPAWRWPTFSALHCQQLSRSATAASVHCTFTESRAPSAGNPDSFWTIYLHRQPDGRWLITDYGQP